MKKIISLLLLSLVFSFIGYVRWSDSIAAKGSFIGSTKAPIWKRNLLPTKKNLTRLKTSLKYYYIFNTLHKKN